MNINKCKFYFFFDLFPLISYYLWIANLSLTILFHFPSSQSNKRKVEKGKLKLLIKSKEFKNRFSKTPSSLLAITRRMKQLMNRTQGKHLFFLIQKWFLL